MHGIKSHEKYPEELRRFALTLNYHSPRAYDFVRETFSNNLPHASTLRSWFHNSDITVFPGVHQSVLNILKKKAISKLSEGLELVVSLCFDEMHIRKHIQWCHALKCLLGYVTYGWDDSNPEAEKPIADQVMVCMVNGLNENLQIPIAYHFINGALNAEHKRSLILEVIAALHSANIKVANITFDGLPSNLRMCQLLGANLKYDDPNFQPYFTASNGDRIYILLDACHMLKLVRNTFGDGMELRDGNKENIDWKYIKELVKFKEKGLSLTHKLNQKHLQWERRKMKVSIASQTLSASTSNSMGSLLEQRYDAFRDSAPTARFCQNFNDVFDIFNTKSNEHSNPLKNCLSKENKTQIYEKLDAISNYIPHLTLLDNGKRKKVIESNRRVGFLGFLINIKSLKLMFEQFVEGRNPILEKIPSFYLMQDTLEVFFGKNRAHCGFNDNPTVEQFVASYKKLIAYDNVFCSTRANCEPNSNEEPLSNIIEISSRSTKSDESCLNIEPSSEEMDQLNRILAQLAEAEEISNTSEGLSDISIAHIANMIEQKFKSAEIYCCSCITMFYENEKLQQILPHTQAQDNPCKSTFLICKNADKFLKSPLLDGTVKFNVLLYAIYRELDLDFLYANTDFTDHEDHKLYFIRTIVNAYAHIKGTHIAKNITISEQETFLRSYLR